MSCLNVLWSHKDNDIQWLKWKAARHNALNFREKIYVLLHINDDTSHVTVVFLVAQYLGATAFPCLCEPPGINIFDKLLHTSLQTLVLWRFLVHCSSIHAWQVQLVILHNCGKSYTDACYFKVSSAACRIWYIVFAEVWHVASQL